MNTEFVERNEKKRKKEKHLQVYFAVSPSWSRALLLDPQSPEYLFHPRNRLAHYEQNALQHTYPSVSQPYLEKLLLYSPNPFIYNRKNSCMRGKTHHINRIRNWQKQHFLAHQKSTKTSSVKNK